MSLLEQYGNALSQYEYEKWSREQDLRKQMAAMQQSQIFGGLTGALSHQQAAQQVRAVSPQPQPNPVLLLAGEDE